MKRSISVLVLSVDSIAIINKSFYSQFITKFGGYGYQSVSAFVFKLFTESEPLQDLIHKWWFFLYDSIKQHISMHVRNFFFYWFSYLIVRDFVDALRCLFIRAPQVDLLKVAPGVVILIRAFLPLVLLSFFNLLKPPFNWSY